MNTFAVAIGIVEDHKHVQPPLPPVSTATGYSLSYPGSIYAPFDALVRIQRQIQRHHHVWRTLLPLVHALLPRLATEPAQDTVLTRI